MGTYRVGAMSSPASLPVPHGNARRLECKIIVVSGGTQGCGEGIAIACAHEGAEGVVICGRQADKGAAVAAAIEEIGSQALYVKADLVDADQTKAVIAAADA